jgi:hypothetical protein
VQVDGAQQAAHRRAEDEAQAEHRAQHAEALGALFRRADVSHVGVGHRRIGLHAAAHQAHRDQHPQLRGQRGGEEVDGQPAKAQQQHRPATEAVRQRAEDGRAKEIGDAEGEADDAQPEGLIRLRAGEAAHQRRQHRHDDADRHHVDQHRDHDEAHAGGTWACSRRTHKDP